MNNGQDEFDDWRQGGGVYIKTGDVTAILRQGQETIWVDAQGLPTEEPEWAANKDLSKAMNDGHGHVIPRADGVKARCGGPSMCRICQRELSVANNTVLPEPKNYPPMPKVKEWAAQAAHTDANSSPTTQHSPTPAPEVLKILQGLDELMIRLHLKMTSLEDKLDRIVDALADDQDPDEMPATYMDGSPVNKPVESDIERFARVLKNSE